MEVGRDRRRNGDGQGHRSRFRKFRALSTWRLSTGRSNSTPSTARATVCSGPMEPPQARSNSPRTYDITTPLGVTATPDGDFNGDSFSDILWQNASSGQASIWDMNGNALIGGGTVSPNPGPSLESDRNGRLQRRQPFRHPVAEHEHGQASIWEMNGNTLIGGGAVSPNPGPSWQAIGTGDFNGDGHSDILFQNTSSGQVSIWEMNGNNLDRRRAGQPQSRAELGKRSEPAISTTTAIPTSCFRTRAAAKSRSGR